MVRDADWSDVSAGQRSLVGDTADEIARTDVAPPTDTDVDQPGAGADVAALLALRATLAFLAAVSRTMVAFALLAF